MIKSLTLAAALAISAGAASATTVSFDSFAANTAITNQFAGDGVTFRGLEEGSEVAIVTDGLSNGHLTNCYTTFCDQRADILEIAFSSLVSNVSLVLESFGSLSVTFNAYDTGGSLLESLSSTGSDVTVSFTSSNISRIDGVQPTDSWGWGLTDLSFDSSSAAIPVPAALPLLATGFGLLGFVGRRRKNAAS